MCMADGDFYNDVARTEYRRAAKAHRCDECSRMIGRGEQYRLDVTLSEGWWHTNRTCPHCDVARAWLSEECDGWLFGAVAMDLEEHWDESDLLRSWGMARWIVGYRHRWHRRDGTLLRVPDRIPVPQPSA